MPRINWELDPRMTVTPAVEETVGYIFYGAPYCVEHKPDDATQVISKSHYWDHRPTCDICHKPIPVANYPVPPPGRLAFDDLPETWDEDSDEDSDEDDDRRDRDDGADEYGLYIGETTTISGLTITRVGEMPPVGDYATYELRDIYTYQIGANPIIRSRRERLVEDLRHYIADGHDDLPFWYVNSFNGRYYRISM